MDSSNNCYYYGCIFVWTKKSYQIDIWYFIINKLSKYISNKFFSEEATTISHTNQIQSGIKKVYMDSFTSPKWIRADGENLEDEKLGNIKIYNN